MKDPLTVLPAERGILRLFSLAMPPEQARFLAEPGAAAQMLGVDDLDPDQINILNVEDFDDIGLDGYLTRGCAIPEDQIDHAALAALSGHVLAVRSRAFKGNPVTLVPDPRLTLIGAYEETPTDWSADPMQSTVARRRATPRDARAQARQTGFVVFVAIMVLLVAIVILVVT